jgi:hypothetical protein
MTITLLDLVGAWHSMMDTLQRRLDECSSDALLQQWMGIVTRMQAISRDTQWWSNLADEDSRYAKLVAMLDQATRALAAARNDPQALARALDKASSAVALVEDFHAS